MLYLTSLENSCIYLRRMFNPLKRKKAGNLLVELPPLLLFLTLRPVHSGSGAAGLLVHWFLKVFLAKFFRRGTFLLSSAFSSSPPLHIPLPTSELPSHRLSSHFLQPQLATEEEAILSRSPGTRGTSTIKLSESGMPWSWLGPQHCQIQYYVSSSRDPTEPDLLLCACCLAMKCKPARPQGRSLGELSHCSCHSSPEDRNPEFQRHLPVHIYQRLIYLYSRISFFSHCCPHSWSRWLPSHPSQAPLTNLQKHNYSHHLSLPHYHISITCWFMHVP